MRYSYSSRTFFEKTCHNSCVLVCILIQWRSEGNWRPGANLNFAPPPLKKNPKILY